MLSRRGIIPWLLFAGWLSVAMDQPPARADDPPPVISSPGGKSTRAPIKAAKWPFKFGKDLFSKRDDAKDPFLTQGAVSQQILARQLAPANVTVPTQTGTSAPAGSIPIYPGQQYPWPAPVDTRPDSTQPTADLAAAPVTPQIPESTATTWGTSPLVTQQQTPPADSAPPAIAQVQNPETTASGRQAATGGVVTSATPQGTPSAAATQSAFVRNLEGPQPTYPAPHFRPEPNRGGGTTGGGYSADGHTLEAYATGATDGHTLEAYATTGATDATGRDSDFVPNAGLVSAKSSPPGGSPQYTATSRPTPQRVGPIDQSIWGTSFTRTDAAAPPASSMASTNPPGTPPVAPPATSTPPGLTGGPRTQTDNGVVRTSGAATASAAKDTFAIDSSIPKDPRVALLESPALQSQTIPVTKPEDARGIVEEGTDVLAVVGNQTILKGDVLGQVNEQLAPYRESVSEAELAAQREQIINQLLPRLVEQKLIVYDFLKQIPVEKLPELEKVVFENYNEKQLPEILEKTGLKTAAELDAKLRELGSSLATQQRMFFERMLAAEAVNREVPRDTEISHEEMLQYYNAHLQDYAFPSKVRWEQLVVRKDQYPSWQQAYNALVEMGNRVKRGVPFEEVARQASQGPRASNGGRYDWTSQGSLVSQELDRVLFSIKPGELSKIITDEDGYHIVRVNERVVAGRQPFTAVQAEIKKRLQEEHFKAGIEQYVERLRRETVVWTRGQGEANVVPSQYVAP